LRNLNERRKIVLSDHPTATRTSKYKTRPPNYAVPTDLRLELQDAEAAEQHALEIKNTAAKRFDEAEAVLRRFWENSGPTLSERGWKKHAEMRRKSKSHRRILRLRTACSVKR